MTQPAPAPSPQEIHRKLSVHSAAKSSNTNSGNESDSDSVLSPETVALSPGISGSALSQTVLSNNPPLSSIAERHDGSDSEEEDEEEEGGWKTATTNPLPPHQEVIKTGYLWKKGERRKTWKKRWFVLRPQHIAYYKTAAEYQLLRLLELSDVHSCTQVSLKRHDNTFGLVSPVRTFYLQAKTQKEVQEWVTAIDLARQTLSLAPKSTVVAPITIPVATSISAPPPLTPSPPNFPPHFHNTTSSESEDASPDPRSIQGASNAPASPTRPSVTDPGKVVVSGYLMKCGSKRRTWRKRWFVLTGEKLVYYASHMDTKPHRQFLLSAILDAIEYDLQHRQQPPASPPAAPVSEAEEPGSAHTFKIITTKRTLLLCAPGEDEEIKWLGAIRALIARRSGAGVVPGEASKSISVPGSIPGSSMTSAATTSPVDSNAPSSGFSSGGGSGGLKGKVRRLSASTGPALTGGLVETTPSGGAQEKT